MRGADEVTFRKIQPRRGQTQPELLCQCDDSLLVGAQPLAAKLDHGTVFEGYREHPPTDTVSRLQHREAVVALGQPAGGGETGHSGADHNDAGHEPYSAVFRSPKICVAASLPGPPMTQPPGWVPEPHW